MRMRKKHKGYTLIELVFALVLMSFVLILATAMVNLTTKGFLGTNTQVTLVREDSEFAAKLNETIQESTSSFTVPKQSFIEEKLTSGWNYLGLMDNVHIPEACSRTGKEIASAQALVYIEYVGTTAPASVPEDCNLLNNVDGYFIQKILGHAFTDSNGLNYEYSLVFQPTDPVNTATQTLIYEFNSTITDADGNLVGSGTGIDIDTMLNALNAVQVVYKGSEVNPAVALAFRSDFLPTYSVGMINTNKPAATIVMVLDVSGSMGHEFSSTTRIQALKDTATDFVEKLSANDKINIIIVPFSSYTGYRLSNPQWSYNAYSELDALKNRIRELKASGNTNVGDGLRRAYYEIQNLQNTGTEMGSIFMLLMTDGEMNTASRTRDGRNYYMGADIVPPKTSTTTSYARQYTTIWGQKIVDEYTTTNYLISLCGGMTNADKAVLEPIFNTTAFDVDNLTDFQETFEQINQNINNIMWAFEGPKL